MIREAYALMTGLFVVSLGTMMILMGLFLGDFGKERDIYVLTTRGTVSGLNPESEVIYRGVKAGKVTSIGFDPDDMTNILVEIELDKGLPITRGTFATLRVQPLTGLAQVELDDARDRPEALFTDPRHPARIPIRPSLMDQLTGYGSDILGQVLELTHRLNRLLGDDNQQRIEDILVNMDRTVLELGVLERSLGNHLGRLPAVEQRLQSALSDHSAAARSVRETSERVGQLARSAADVVTRVMNLTGTLDTEQLPELTRLLAELRMAASEFRNLSKNIRHDPQMFLRGPPNSMPGPGEPGFEE